MPGENKWQETEISVPSGPWAEHSTYNPSIESPCPTANARRELMSKNRNQCVPVAHWQSTQLVIQILSVQILSQVSGEGKGQKDRNPSCSVVEHSTYNPNIESLYPTPNVGREKMAKSRNQRVPVAH